nr:alpha/beta hydrolase [Micromonospora sp. DSM 115978]
MGRRRTRRHPVRRPAPRLRPASQAAAEAARRPAVAGAASLLLVLGLLGPVPGVAAAGTPSGTPARAGTATPAMTGSVAAAGSTVPDAMRAAGHPYADWADQGRSFLVFDPRGDGRAVEVVGDLATADRIAVLVPGVANDLRAFDRGVGGIRHRAPAAQARALHRQLRDADPATGVAVIAWLGYDPPEGIGWAAASSERARSGAVELAGLVRRLAATRPAAAIALIGHSYGSLVVGLAAPGLPCQVTDLVALGGVGMGAADVPALGTPARVWAAQAADDWIRWLPPVRVFGLGHGARPADPGFGARPLPGGTGHDGYLVPGGPTLPALARVVLGQPAAGTDGEQRHRASR